MEDNAKNNRNVFIRGNDSRGDEVISVLSDFGGLNNYCFDGSGKDRVYFINHVGFIDYEEEHRELAKIIMDNYREIKLPEQWKDGDVLVDIRDSANMALYESIDDKEPDLFNAHLKIRGDRILLDTLEVRDKFRLATPQEIEEFHNILHDQGKDWDAEKEQLVDWLWKPEMEHWFYLVDIDGRVKLGKHDKEADRVMFDFGNCFQTKEEAEVAAERVKKALKGE